MLATRTRGAGLVVVAPCRLQGHCVGEKSLSTSVKQCCDVPAVASKAQPAFAWCACERATAIAIYREEAQHACLRSVRAVPGWL